MARIRFLSPCRTIATSGVSHSTTNAVSADIWMSLHPDGRGALKQGKGLKSSPSQVSGFLADTEFHAFLVWMDKDGRTSVPSAPFKFKLVDHFQHQ